MYLSENEIRIIAAQIIDCLFYMHSKGVIYGDLKAENILISSNGTIKICDFNLSGTCSLLKNDIQGTISYLSPEMINCCERTHKSDFWSLGVLLHLLYYRKYPFQNFKNSNMLVNIVNVNIISEPRNRRASYEFRSLIYSLLEKDLDLRIGEDKREFENHSFFEDFNWNEYFRKKNNFQYAKNYNIEEQSESEDYYKSSVQSEDSDILKKDNLTSKFYGYNIKGFTFDALSSGEINCIHNFFYFF